MRAASGYHWSQQIRTPIVAYRVFHTRKPPGFTGLFAVVVEMPVARGEVILLVEQRVVGDVHLPVDAKQAAIGVDDRRRVPVEAGGLPLENRHDDHDGQLAGKLLHRVGRRPGNRFGEIEAIALLRLAEVERVEQLLQADDLRASPGRVPHQPLGAPKVALRIRVRVILDDPDREHLWPDPHCVAKFTTSLRARFGRDNGAAR